MDIQQLSCLLRYDCRKLLIWLDLKQIHLSEISHFLPDMRDEKFCELSLWQTIHNQLFRANTSAWVKDLVRAARGCSFGENGFELIEIGDSLNVLNQRICVRSERNLTSMSILPKTPFSSPSPIRFSRPSPVLFLCPMPIPFSRPST
jgi:hypothetical protein